MITALLVVGNRDVSLGEPVRISAEAASTGGGGLDLETGDVYSVRALLFALLLSSSNDSAVALAEHVSGSEEQFVDAMNRAARRLGADDTNFVTSHGLDEPNHYSSARDLALIGAEVLADPTLARIVSTPVAEIRGPNGYITVENRNELLDVYRGAVGIKTGFTENAGEVLVAAARRHGRRLIAVAMGSADAFEDARNLLDLGFRRLARSVVVPAGRVVGEIVLDSGRSADAVLAAPVRGWSRPEEIEIAFAPAPVSAPVTVGERLGMVTVSGRSEGTKVEAVAAAPLPASARPSWAVDTLAGILGSAYRLAALAGGGEL
jgi:serine-type D-Ala-D-Ala carboxypeptidase (penicillin-binding protein 5/6)